ncbi:hypothetical protein DL96DRAFT_1580029 [Flagelloscypha sp. PMI_526]|nr:hypothetical protein DL96DRAFT_1580029 [Flagelloscypha sp. PMI_526]
MRCLAFSGFLLLGQLLLVLSAPNIVIEVTGPDSVDDVANLQVHTKISNQGYSSFTLLPDPRSVVTPFPGTTFIIQHAETTLKPTFLGAKAKFNPSFTIKSNQSLMVLTPGQSQTVTHNLAGFYNFSHTGPGIYSIAPNPVLLYIDPDSNEHAEIEAVKTVSHNVTLSGKLIAPHPGGHHVGNFTSGRLQRRDGPAHTVNCVSAQYNLLAAAIPWGVQYAVNGANYANDHSTESDWIKWFGPASPRHKQAVAGFFRWLVTTYFWTDYTYECNNGLCESGEIAFVYPSRMNYIYLCNGFWNLRTNGLDSAGGTLVHEASHFATTDDFRYGTSLSLQLAIDYPNLAVINADSTQFFSEWVSGER